MRDTYYISHGLRDGQPVVIGWTWTHDMGKCPSSECSFHWALRTGRIRISNVQRCIHLHFHAAVRGFGVHLIHRWLM